MNSAVYEFIAQTARYAFAVLMLLITFRAVRGVLVDNRRAEKLRRLLPMTGQCGELVVLTGGDHAVKGMRYPVIREGIIGSARRCDVRIRHGSVRRIHAYFLLRDGGLSVRTHAGSHMRDAKRRPVRELLLMDGARFFIGPVELLLVLNLPEQPVTGTTGRGTRKHLDDYEHYEEEEDELFAPSDFDEAEEDSLFDTTDFNVSEPISTPREVSAPPPSKRAFEDIGWGDLPHDTARANARPREKARRAYPDNSSER